MTFLTNNLSNTLTISNVLQALKRNEAKIKEIGDIALLNVIIKQNPLQDDCVDNYGFEKKNLV